MRTPRQIYSYASNYVKRENKKVGSQKKKDEAAVKEHKEENTDEIKAFGNAQLPVQKVTQKEM